VVAAADDDVSELDDVLQPVSVNPAATTIATPATKLFLFT
jgi:hypothetical protein